MEFKEIIIGLRKEKKFTQKQVAELLQMSETGYASWEQGLAEPSLLAVKRLCIIYDVSADYLLGLED